jgi:predicted metal-dependent HD superfamily phosphohydrolase
MYSIAALKSNWDNLLKKFAIEEDVSDRVFRELERLYTSAYRFYHNLAHIQQVLEVITSLQARSYQLEFIELAAWFHDVIYDSQANDNEEKSADYADRVLNRLGIPPKTIESVKNLILITKNHQCLATDIDAQILLDADLSILGQSEAEYQFYASAIRQEYSWLSPNDYQQGRKLFLQKLLQRERIYLTEEIFAMLEGQARQNIQAEIIFLS